MSEKEEKYELPARFRLTPDLLAAADEQQRAWREQFNQPFASPKERARGRAALIIKDRSVSPQERYEACITLGRFDLAMRVPQISKDLYLDALQMVIASERADEEWCAHPQACQYVEREVYSVRHSRDAYLLRCNECGFRNLTPDLPDHIQKGRSDRRASRERFRGMTPSAVKEALARRF